MFVHGYAFLTHNLNFPTGIHGYFEKKIAGICPHLGELCLQLTLTQSFKQTRR